MIVSTKFLQTQESLPLIYLALQRQGQQTTSCVSVMICELASRYWRRTFLYMRMSQTTTDNSQMLSRLSHVDEVQYKRWNHYKVHQAHKTWVTFRRHLEFSPWSQVSLKEGCLGEGGWGGERLERQGEVVGISLNGGRFESFVFFVLLFFFLFFLFWFLL